MSEFKVDPATLNGLSVYKELGDFSGSLKELKENVDKLIKKYGEDSFVIFDAGYNNIDCKLVTTQMIEQKQNQLAALAAKKLADKEEKDRKKWEKLNKKFAK